MIAGLLLAAGQSKRFGERDKLLAQWAGGALIKGAADLLRSLELDQRIAVVSSPEVEAELGGFEIIQNAEPEAGMGRSLSLGIEAVRASGASRVLIALGDMPFVTVAHGQAVVERCTEERGSASVLEGRRMPPACFPRRAFEALGSVAGDRGARDLIAALPEDALVSGDAQMLVDIDTPEALRGAGS